jgi:hypothetical protein
MVMLERPAEAAKAVREFLDQIDASRLSAA